MFEIRASIDSLIVSLIIESNADSFYISEDQNSTPQWSPTIPTQYGFDSRGYKTLYLWVKTGEVIDRYQASCTLVSSLTGNEQFVQHMGTKTISLDAIVTYIGKGGNSSSSASAPTSDTIIKIPAGQQLSGHKVVAQENGVLVYASNTAYCNVVGITQDAFSLGSDAIVQFRGYMDEPTWNWVLDKPIFLGINGGMTQIVPTVGLVQILASVISRTRILINIQEPILLG